MMKNGNGVSAEDEKKNRCRNSPSSLFRLELIVSACWNKTKKKKKNKKQRRTSIWRINTFCDSASSILFASILQNDEENVHRWFFSVSLTIDWHYPWRERERERERPKHWKKRRRNSLKEENSKWMTRNERNGLDAVLVIIVVSQTFIVDLCVESMSKTSWDFVLEY